MFYSPVIHLSKYKKCYIYVEQLSIPQVKANFADSLKKVYSGKPFVKQTHKVLRKMAYLIAFTFECDHANFLGSTFVLPGIHFQLQETKLKENSD